jgi:hypothetical protein
VTIFASTCFSKIGVEVRDDFKFGEQFPKLSWHFIADRFDLNWVRGQPAAPMRQIAPDGKIFTA